MTHNKIRTWTAAVGATVLLGLAGCGAATLPSGSGSHAPTPPSPTQTDPLTSKGWHLASANVTPSQYGTKIEGSVTNTESTTRTAVFTLVVLKDGQEVHRTTGSAGDVPAGATVPVTFVGLTADEHLPAGPYSFSLWTEMSS